MSETARRLYYCHKLVLGLNAPVMSKIYDWLQTCLPVLSNVSAGLLYNHIVHHVERDELLEVGINR